MDSNGGGGNWLTAAIVGALAGVALEPKKTVLEQAALEIRLELIFHVSRQRSILGSASIPERGIVLGHELV